MLYASDMQLCGQAAFPFTCWALACRLIDCASQVEAADTDFSIHSECVLTFSLLRSGALLLPPAPALPCRGALLTLASYSGCFRILCGSCVVIAVHLPHPKEWAPCPGQVAITFRYREPPPHWSQSAWRGAHTLQVDPTFRPAFGLQVLVARPAQLEGARKPTRLHHLGQLEHLGRLGQGEPRATTSMKAPLSRGLPSAWSGRARVSPPRRSLHLAGWNHPPVGGVAAGCGALCSPVRSRERWRRCSSSRPLPHSVLHLQHFFIAMPFGQRNGGHGPDPNPPRSSRCLCGRAERCFC